MVFEVVARTDGEGRANMEYRIEDAKLCCPLGYGPQDRYELSAKFHSNNIVVSASSSSILPFKHMA